MKVFIAFLIASLAVAAQASYQSSVWPYSGAWNSWNNGWNGHHGLAAYPYANTWSSAWPTTDAVYGHGLYGHKTVVQANVADAYPWGQPWGTYGAGWGHHGLAKTVVQSNVGHNAWGLPWGTYGAGVYGGWGHHAGLAHTVVPVSKQIAATPGSVHVATVPVDGEKVVY